MLHVLFLMEILVWQHQCSHHRGMRGLDALPSTIHKKKKKNCNRVGGAGFAVLVNAVWSCTLVKQHNVQPGHSCLLRAAGADYHPFIVTHLAWQRWIYWLTSTPSFSTFSHLKEKNIYLKKNNLTHALRKPASQTEFSLTLLLVQPLLVRWAFSMQRKSFPSPFCSLSLSLCVLGSRGTEKGEAL